MQPFFSSLSAFFSRLFASFRPQERTYGEPASSNGASSFHLWWELPYGQRLVAVSVLLEVIEPPAVDRLYFWALQVSFVRPDGGGAHIGLQHHPSYPGNGAVNWGGYAPPADGGELTGSVSPLSSTLDNVNTRDFLWEPHRPYRLSISRSPDPAPNGFYAWRGEIEDVAGGARTLIRDLYSRGEYLRGPVVWTEAFARCEHTPAAVRWRELTAVPDEGDPIVADAVSVNYQTHEAGGCANTDVQADGVGWVQRTGTERLTRPGATVRLV